MPLVTALLAETDRLSLTTETADGPIAHICLTPCTIAPAPAEGDPPAPLGPGEMRGRPAMLLGPLAVSPDLQRRGHGSKLVADALARVATRPGKPPVFVLGDPAYYGRFGFHAAHNVAPPYPLPEAWYGAWQALSLTGEPLLNGVLHVPEVWAKPAYWTDAP
ncbi:MAG: N-acetyltransferase [Pseudomonadota bacterium]